MPEQSVAGWEESQARLESSLKRGVVFDELAAVEKKAWDALARHQMWVFGEYASRWYAIAMLWKRGTGEAINSPFGRVVEEARRRWCLRCRKLREPDHRCPSPGR